IEKRLVVAALGLPALDGLDADALPPYGQARHVVRRVDREKQHESEEIDADEDQHAVEQPANDVCGHASPSARRGAPPVSAASCTVCAARRRKARHAGQTAAATASGSKASGHQIGVFHSRMRCARSAGSIFMYCSVLRTICVGLALPTHWW